ncbi:MAG: efflux RND transporter periplasmic adaptor subunit [Desulfatirhabdiaceae bacterium]
MTDTTCKRMPLRPIAIMRSGVHHLLILLVMVTIITGCKKEEKSAAGPPPPPEVEVMTVIQKDVPVFADWVGTTDGLINASIRAQVQGYLIKQNYQEGDNVKKGQILFEIDPREYQAAVDRSKAVLQQAMAALEQSRAEVGVQTARWDTARANFARIKPLAEQSAVSQKDLDDATGMELSTRAAVEAAKASVGAAQAQIIGAQAELDKAQLNLGFTRITSPVDGVAGLAKAQLGDLVGPGSKEELTTVSDLDPIKVYSQLSEKEYMIATQKKSTKQPRTPLELILTDGSVYPHKGEFNLIDRQVDVKTGTIKVGALFPNPGGVLRPGQFAKVRAEIALNQGAILVPQRAVSELQGSYQVAVVGPDNKVDIRPVKVGDRIGPLWVITEGLKPGEQVIAEGVQKVRPGMTVQPKPFAPAAQPAATPSTQSAKG